MDGVAVEGLVAVIAGEGVMTKNVGVLAAGLGLATTGIVADGAAEATTCVGGAAVGAGDDGFTADRFIMTKTAATATKKRPPIKDQRARATYLCRTR